MDCEISEHSVQFGLAIALRSLYTDVGLLDRVASVEGAARQTPLYSSPG